MTSTPSREELNLNADMASWAWLRPHLDRGGLVVISEELDLVTVGFSIASDDTVAVNAWIESGEIYKPTPVQVFDWDADPETPFRFIITSPYVLIQPLIRLVS